MQLLVEKKSISKNTIIEMIQVLWQGGQVELAVELALDVLMLREEWGSKNPARWPGQLDLGGRGALLPWWLCSSVAVGWLATL